MHTQTQERMHTSHHASHQWGTLIHLVRSTMSQLGTSFLWVFKIKAGFRFIIRRWHWGHHGSSLKEKAGIWQKMPLIVCVLVCVCVCECHIYSRRIPEERPCDWPPPHRIWQDITTLAHTHKHIYAQTHKQNTFWETHNMDKKLLFVVVLGLETFHACVPACTGAKEIYPSSVHCKINYFN